MRSIIFVMSLSVFIGATANAAKELRHVSERGVRYGLMICDISYDVDSNGKIHNFNKECRLSGTIRADKAPGSAIDSRPVKAIPAASLSIDKAH